MCALEGGRTWEVARWGGRGKRKVGAQKIPKGTSKRGTYWRSLLGWLVEL